MHHPGLLAEPAPRVFPCWQLEGVSSLYKGFVPIAARKVRADRTWCGRPDVAHIDVGLHAPAPRRHHAPRPA